MRYRETRAAQVKTGRQALSPSEKIRLLERALCRGHDACGIVARACGVCVQTVAEWSRTGLYGDQSAREIQRLIDHSDRLSQQRKEAFIDTYKRAGFRRYEDFEQAWLGHVWRDKWSLNIEHGRGLGSISVSTLDTLRTYIAKRDAALEAERRREARHFGRRRSIADLIG